MQGKVAVFLTILAIALAQQDYSVFQINSGVTYTASIPVPVGNGDQFATILYAIWVPENTSSVDFFGIDQNTVACDYVDVWFIQSVLPCSDSQETVPGNNLCEDGANIGDGIGGDAYPFSFYPGQNTDDMFEYRVNSWWYFGLSRYFSGSDACSFQFNVTLHENCLANQIGASSNLDNTDSAVCLTYSTVTTFPSNFTFLTNTNTNWPTYKLNISQNTGSFSFKVVAYTNEIYIYGKSYGAPSDYEYNCYFGDGTTNNDIVYTYDVTCYTPRAGPFYVIIYDEEDTNGINGTVTFNAPVVCTLPAAGFNCSYQAVALNISNLSKIPSTSVAYNPDATYLSVPFVYYYFDIPANYSAGVAVVTFTSNVTDGGDVIFYVRRDGFPETDSDYGYEDSDVGVAVLPRSISFSQFDWSVPGRIWIGLSCESEGGCAFGGSANVTGSTGTGTGSGVVTTGATASGTSLTTGKGLTTFGLTTLGITTATSSTGGAESSSSAVFVVPSIFFAALAAFLALF